MAGVLTEPLLQRQMVADAMLTDVKVHNARTTVREIRALFDDEHVHAAVIVEAGELLAVVDRADLETADDDALALHLGRRRRRVIAPDADLALAKRLMLAGGRRRLAVVDRDGKLKGLLCLKRSRSGFCSDRDVRARSALGARTASGADMR
jgi:CBS domain-containing protein